TGPLLALKLDDGLQCLEPLPGFHRINILVHALSHPHCSVWGSFYRVFPARFGETPADSTKFCRWARCRRQPEPSPKRHRRQVRGDGGAGIGAGAAVVGDPGCRVAPAEPPWLARRTLARLTGDTRIHLRLRHPGERGRGPGGPGPGRTATTGDRKSTRLNSSHVKNSYAVFCL